MDERYFGAVFAIGVLILVLIGVGALLRQHPNLGRARVVIPVSAGAAALLGTVNEIAFGNGISAAPKSAAFAGLAGVVWGVVFAGIIMTVRWVASRRAQ